MHLRSVAQTLVSEISFTVYGESNSITKSLIRDRLNSVVRRGRIESKQLNIKLFNKSPSILNLLSEYPIRLSRHPREWLPWFGESVGCSFYLFPWEAQEGVLFVDPELNDWFYDLDLILDQFVVVTDGGTTFELYKDLNNLWHGFDQIVKEFDLLGGERIGVCCGRGKTVLLEVLERNSPIKKFQEIIRKILSTTSPREIADQLYSLGIRRLNGEIKERTYKGLIELGISHEICVRIFKDLEKKIQYTVSFDTNKVHLTPRILEIKEDERERGNSLLSYPTEDLLTELSVRFNRLKAENERLGNKCNELLLENEKISNELVELKAKLELQSNHSFQARRNNSNGSQSNNTELPTKDKLRRFTELYKRNGPVVVYLTTVLSMAGNAGLTIEDLEEIVYIQFSLKRSDLDSILDAFPFFVKHDGICYLDIEMHKVTILASLNEPDSFVTQKHEEQSEQEQNIQSKSVVQSLAAAKSDLDPITASTDDIIDKIWETNQFDLSMFCDCIRGLMNSGRYSTIVELESLMKDVLLNSRENSEKFRLSLLIISFSYLYLDDFKNAEEYWDYYVEASELSGESDIENFLFAIKLSFVLETDDELFDVIGDNILLEKLKTEKLDAEAYTLVYSILNNENNGQVLLQRLKKLLEKYHESLNSGSLDFVDLHRRFIESIRLTVNLFE
jgi:hypothetical protein